MGSKKRSRPMKYGTVELPDSAFTDENSILETSISFKDYKLRSNRQAHIDDMVEKIRLSAGLKPFTFTEAHFEMLVVLAYTWGWDACAANVRAALPKKK